MMGFDTKFGFGICICNEEEKSWVSNKVWICINKEIKRNEAEKWWGLIKSIYIYIIRQWGRKILGFGRSVDLNLTKK